jgi:hypothetical protein
LLSDDWGEDPNEISRSLVFVVALLDLDPTRPD